MLEVLRRDAGSRCSFHAAVVMDDHVHVLCGLLRGMTAARLLHAWKSVSAHELCQYTRAAPVWQPEYHLRWMNSAHETVTCATYIRSNPTRRWPGTEHYPWLL